MLLSVKLENNDAVVCKKPRFFGDNMLVTLTRFGMLGLQGQVCCCHEWVFLLSCAGQEVVVKGLNKDPVRCQRSPRGCLGN